MKVRNVLQCPEPDLDTVFSFRCERCDREFHWTGIRSECLPCRVASLRMYGASIRGGVSGS